MAGLSGVASRGNSPNPVVACVDPLTTPEPVITLLEAVRQLRAGGVNALALIVGEGPASPHLRAWARGYDAMEWAVLAEATYDPDGVLAAADVVVACGGTLDSAQFAVEAMGRGIPAVLAGSEGNYELVVDGDSGVIYQPGNAESLAQQLRDVLTNATLRARLMRGGLAAVADRLSLEAMIDATLVAYDRGRGVAVSQRLSTVGGSGRTSTKGQSTVAMRGGSRRSSS
jgi:glycosyltransferase involved in cell wall biosynthesis